MKYKNKKGNKLFIRKLPYFSAEKEGFEPPDLLQSTVFKTAAIDHSAISPRQTFLFLSGANIVTFNFMAKFK